MRKRYTAVAVSVAIVFIFPAAARTARGRIDLNDIDSRYLNNSRDSRPVVSQSTRTSPRDLQNTQLIRVPSKDGTLIAVECSGSGPNLLIVHGGTGDRTRWTPLFPLLSTRFTVCAMDRRGHGDSSDSSDYSLQKEVEDVATVVNARPGPVIVLGHSFGGVCALDATFLTKKISKLILYEPPLREDIDIKLVSRIERMVRKGQREAALIVFLREGVKFSESAVTAMRSQKSWPKHVATVDLLIRQMVALSHYRFEPKRMTAVHAPTLLLQGSETASPSLKVAIHTLQRYLPNSTLVMLQGQEHNAMDTDPQQLAEVVTSFLLGVKAPRTNGILQGHRSEPQP